MCAAAQKEEVFASFEDSIILKIIVCFHLELAQDKFQLMDSGGFK